MRDDELNSLRFEIEHVKQQNTKYVDDAHELQAEIEALNKHMKTLEHQNYDVRIILF